MDPSAYQKYIYKTFVQETDIDGFGHLNNANYLKLFEHARWDFIAQNGFTLERIKSTQKGPVILDIHVRFLRELHPRQKIEIHSQVLSYRAKIARLQQEIYVEKKKAAEAIFMMGYWDLEKRKLVKMDQSWLSAIGIQTAKELI